MIGAILLFATLQRYCCARVVAYVFTGAPGSNFSYNGKAHTLPPTARLELIAEDHSYVLAGDALPIPISTDVAVDQFGAATVPLGTTGKR
jgi:hypothetical protein